MEIIERLKEWNACSKAITWLEEEKIKSFPEAFEKCKRGDWMLWLHYRLYPDRVKERASAAGHCANTVRHLIKDKRSLDAIDSSIAYGEVPVTYAAAYAASYAVDAATYAADYAAASAYAAAAADYAAADAYAAAAVAYAAAAAYAAADADAVAVAAAATASAYAVAAAADAAAVAVAADAVAVAHAAKAENRHLTAEICREILTFI